MARSKVMLGTGICFFAVSIIFASGAGSSAQKQHGGVKSAGYQQPNTNPQALESVTASEVEYVDGPLAPLYDFLNEKKLFKFCKLLRDAQVEQVLLDVGGSWTVFPPTDASFIFLPAGSLEEFQRNPQLLREFILYHFVTGDFPSNQIQNEMLVDTVQGANLRFNIYGQTVTVSGAQILEPDLTFDLGRIYIIDRPLYPIPSEDIVTYMQRNFKEAYRILYEMNLLDYISSGTFTILVPDDEAFNYLSAELKEAISTNRTLGERIILNHVLLGSIYVGGITNGMQMETVGGDVITFTVKRGIYFANDIPIVLSDVPVTNGVIHVLNRVLLPEGIEADCQCKASTGSAKKPSQTPGRNDQTFGQNQRPQLGQRTTTQRPIQRQTPRPSSQGRPVTNQGRPVGPAVNRPWSPTRTAQTVRPIHTPIQVTQPPYAPITDATQSDDDFNSVVDTDKQTNVGQKKPDYGRTTRYPTPPPWQKQHTRSPPQRTTSSESISYPEQDITSGISQTKPPNRWSERKSTPSPRYPTPHRGSYQTPTTRKPLTTRTYDWNQKRTTYEQPSTGVDTSTLQPDQTFQTQRPAVQTTRWEQRQLTRTTKQPTQRPSRIPPPPPPPPQRRPVTTRPPYVPPTVPEQITSSQPFDSSREQPSCRLQTERITSTNRNLPICTDSNLNDCQYPPYNPVDSRPPCPEISEPNCRDANAPYDPSDNRPLCQSPINDPNCREFGKQTYVGDRRPVCPTRKTPQTGCKDPSAPYNPSDRRPVCRPTSPGIVTPSSGCKDPRAPYNPSDRRPVCRTSPPGNLPPGLEDTTANQECRRYDEIANPNDRRPLCTTETVPQTGCKDPNAPYNPSDRRPTCRESSPEIVPITPEDTNVPQGCRRSDEIANPHDRRPLCPPTETVPQTGCKDPSAPYNPSDRRPVCRTIQPGKLPPATVGTSTLPQGCRHPNESPKPNDRRPVCPAETTPIGCKDPNAPYSPTDRRPLCQENAHEVVPISPVDTSQPQGCRRSDEIASPHDRRPLCPIPQPGCKDPRAPYNPSDRRPICRGSPPETQTSAPDITVPTQSCRRADEIAHPTDSRPFCPEEPQEDCRSFLERPRPGDRRPICKINKDQPSTQTTRRQTWQTSTKSPQSWQTTKSPPSWQTSRTPEGTQTTRTPQSWQTTRSPQTWQNTRAPQSWQSTTAGQPIGKQPQAGGIKTPSATYTGPQAEPQFETYPNQPHSEDYPSQPQTGNEGRYPSTGGYPSHSQTGTQQNQPQSGYHQSQPGSHPSPPSSPHSGTYPSGPHSDSRPTQPQSGTYPSQPNSNRYPSQPQSGSYPRQPVSGEPQTDSLGPSRPHSGQGQFQPGRPRPTVQPQRRPSSPQTQSRYTTPASQPVNQGVSRPSSADVRPPQALSPHVRPGSAQGHQSGSFTTTPGRPVTTTTRVPIPVTGTSNTPEDSRRTLHEIVEAPALLIRGRPVKLTKILELFKKAGLEDILLGPGPTTVFLPSDDAFATLPKGVIEQLEENPELLRQVVSYHVTKAEILPSAQFESFTVPSLEGTQLVITMLNGGRLILISGAKAVAVTRANNGIFYVINQLLYPLPHQDIVGAVQSRPDLTTLTYLLSQTNLIDLLQGETPYTLLAPTDNAFAQLSQVAYEELSRNSTLLQEILLNHVIEGAHYGREFLTGGTFPSLRGSKLRFGVVSYGYQVNDINIKTPEIVTGSGVIHLVDQVLLEDSDLRFFAKLEKALAGNGGSNPGAHQPAGQSEGIGHVGTRPESGHSISSPQQHGQPQVGGLQPTHGQHAPVGRVSSHGQRIPNTQGTHSQNQGTGQTHGNQPPSNTGSVGQQIPGHPTPFGGRRQPTQSVGQPYGSGVQSHGSGGVQPHGSGVQPHGSGVQPHGSGVQPHGSGVQPHGFGVQPHGSGGLQTRGHHQSGQRVQTHGHSSQSGSYIGQSQLGNHAGSGGNQPHGSIQGGGQPNDVADLARSMGLNQFANWISNTGLLEKVHDGGVYTVFAPTDEAVSSLPDDMVHSIESNPEQVKSILQYHIVPQRLNLNSLTNEETSSTLLQGKSIRFNVYRPNSQPDCKQVVTASGTPVGEALATMGSIQVIPVTQVLYQPAGNLLKIIEASPILQQLSEAVKSAKITWILSGNGPLTIFAPSDTAFASLTEEERKSLIEDKQAFTDLLKRHMIRGTIFSSGVQEDVEKKSENHKTIKLSVLEGVLTVNSIPVTFSDITASNGVLHVIDHFL